MFGGNPVYCRFGMIDFLQPYTLKKQIETKYKSLFHDPSQVSCVSPDDYAARFLNFIGDRALNPTLEKQTD